ncbi:unnamed protein product [Adineta steineri]|uniref:C2H2-type domain-containing protein n=2 Tax=Adineta steineri TaxID=433720 RepID=A0A818J5K3_9BILA|nr:unnamed protein product [Adineta steineri]CAF3530905.1 unnamed protein product [Adineta steineri]
MMESTNTTNDQQTPPIIPINNSSSRRKQSKPNRLEHVVLESTPPTCDTINSSTSILPSLTQYHVAAEQQESGGVGDDDSDRVSLNCEDGSLSSHSVGEHYAMEDIINRSRRPSHQQQSRSNDKTNFDENIERMLIEENEQQEDIDHDNETIGALDFSLKLDEANKHSLNRSRSINTTGKPRSLKRKHQNGLTDNNNGTISIPTRIFHADAFCTICRKEFCNKYFLKTHLANKHGIFDQQSVVPSVSTPNLSSLQGNTDTINDSNLQHPFTVISTLLNNGHEDFSSSPTSPSSDMIRNHSNNDDENETELSSLRHEMNGVIAGDEDNDNNNNNHHHEQNDNEDEDDDVDDDDDDEQDGINSNSLINLPQKIATILGNDNLNTHLDNNNNNNNNNDDDDDDNDDDQQETIANSPTNSLDYQQQQASSSTAAALLSGFPTPTSSSSTTANLSRQSSAKLPEDFCDICQKHFCNKYYLRKHRLDVHGVQTDSNIKPYKRIDSNTLSTKNSPPSTSSQQISPSIQLPSSFPNVSFNPSSVQQSLGMLLNPIFSPLVQSQTNSEQSLLSSSNKRRHTDNSNESSSSLSSSKPQFPPSLLTGASDVANVFANQLNSVTNNSTTPTSSSSSKSQISTCHLCGKKFQTNDYLQLHLMNKHQITTDIQNYDSQQQRAKLSNLIKSSNGTINSNTVKKIKLETTETPSSLSPSTTPTTTTSSTTNVTTVIQASSPIDSITSPNPSGVIPGIVDTYFAAKMADRVSCDICHKQVCNKYFLKTHKLKVHGVASDPMLISSSGSLNNSETTEDNIEQQHSRSSLDGSPPQLIVDELNTSNTEPGVIPSPDALTASVNTFINTNTNSTSNDSIDPSSTSICEICSKSFPTKFLHVHMNNVHGIQQAPILVSNNKNQLIANTIKRPSLTNGNNIPGSNTVRLKQTPQVQLRVTCQVCKKELCNKYFLRAHMRNVHNISVDDLRLIQQQSTTSNSTSQLSPCSDQQSSKSTFSLSSNLLSSTSTIPTDMNFTSTIKRSISNDNDLNGHTTDSNESENINLNNLLSSSSTTTTTITNKTSTNDSNNNNRLLSMQPFLVESDDDLYKDLFVPCMVYLPCRHRVTKPLEVSLRLKPVDNTTSTSAATATIAD